MKRLSEWVWFLCGDLISVMHLVFIAGMLTYDPHGQPIPPLYEMTSREPLELIVLSFLAYQIGRILAGVEGSRRPQGEVAAPKKAFLLLSVVAVVVVLAFQVQTLVGYGSLEAAAVAKADIILELGPIARLIYIGLPFLAATLWCQSIAHARHRNAAYVLAFLTAIALAATLFKGQIAIFALTLLYVTLCARTGTEPSLRTVLRSPLFLVALATMVAIFLLSEGDSVLGSTRYVIARAATYSWEGFAYVVETQASPDLEDQMASFFGSKHVLSPGLELAAEMLHVYPPPIGIVVTLPGFLFRNFGVVGVCVGAVALGFMARTSLLRAARTRVAPRTVFWVMLHFALVQAFLVGEVFNLLRGDILTLIVTYGIIRFVETAQLPSVRPTECERAQSSNE